MLPVLRVSGLNKSFVMHAQGGLALPVLQDVALAVAPGECLALVGPSGAGKSTLLRSLYGNYRPQSGSIRVRHRDDAWVELVGRRAARRSLDVRRHTMGFVSQFLRVIPRVGAVDVVAEPMVRLRRARWKRRAAAPSSCSACSAFPQRLWALPPATFSGGEQQRVNIARSLIADYPILLLDEPTASLDTANRDGVIDLIRQRRDAGAAIVGIFHDVDRARCGRHPPAYRRVARSTAMSTENVLTNGRIVTADAEFDGTVVVRDGRIAEVSARPHRTRAGAIDLEGDILVPGLIELHTDNLEKHFSPRPGVKWPRCRR